MKKNKHLQAWNHCLFFLVSNMWPHSLEMLLKLSLVYIETSRSNSNELSWLSGWSSEQASQRTIWPLLLKLTAAERAMWDYEWWTAAHTIPICQENAAQSVKNVLRHSLFLDQVVGQWENGKRPVGCMCCSQINICKWTCRWDSH